MPHFAAPHYTVNAPLRPARSHIQTRLTADAKGGCNLQPLSFYPVRFTADQRPALDRTPVPCLPVCVVGFQNEAGIDNEVQRGFVLKAHINRGIVAGGEDLHKINRLAFDLFKAIERAPTVAADRGLTPLRLGKPQ